MPGCVSENVPFSRGGGGGGDGISRGITNRSCFGGGGAMASQTPVVMGCQCITNTNKFWEHTVLQTHLVLGHQCITNTLYSGRMSELQTHLVAFSRRFAASKVFIQCNLFT